MKYEVECSDSLDELIKFVNDKLKQGWQLQGGIATMTHQPRYTVFYQAMYKEEKSPKSTLSEKDTVKKSTQKTK